MMYRKPDVSKLSRAATNAAMRTRGLQGAPLPSGIRAARMNPRGLGDWFDDMTAGQKMYDIPQGGNFTPVQSYSGGEFTPAGVNASSGGSIGTGFANFFSGLFGSKPSTTTTIMPTSSNTSTYLLIGGVVLGGIVLWSVLK